MKQDDFNEKMEAALAKLTTQERGMVEDCMHGYRFLNNVVVVLAGAAGLLLGTLVS